jgi:hypothetical protein
MEPYNRFQIEKFGMIPLTKGTMDLYSNDPRASSSFY